MFAVLQGVAFTGVQVSREKRLISLHEKKGPENRENQVKLRPPLCRLLKHSMTKFGRPKFVSRNSALNSVFPCAGFCPDKKSRTRQRRDENVSTNAEGVDGGTKTRFTKNMVLGGGPGDSFLIFLSLLTFLGKSLENHRKKQGFLLSSEPLKSLRKKGKTLKKARKFVATKKARKSKKAMKGRSGFLYFLNRGGVSTFGEGFDSSASPEGSQLFTPPRSDPRNRGKIAKNNIVKRLGGPS